MNKAILLGHLGRDPELKTVGNNSSICNFTLATKSRYKDGDEWKDKTTWHKVVVWGKIGENCSKYLSKGSQVLVEGRIENRSYDDKDGVKKYVSEVVAGSVEFLSGKGVEAKKETLKKAPSESEEDSDQLPF